MSYRLQPRIALAALMCGVLSLVLLAALSSGSLGEPAHAAVANKCNATNGGCVPDGGAQTWCEADGFADFAGFSAGRTYALDNMVTQTNYDQQIADPNGDCVTATDTIWIADTSLTPGTRGSYQCKEFNSTGYCASAYIRLNPDELTDTLNLRKTACHELGHSLGLKHHADPYADCMMSGYISSGHQNYNSAHVTNINKRLGDVGH